MDEDEEEGAAAAAWWAAHPSAAAAAASNSSVAARRPRPSLLRRSCDAVRRALAFLFSHAGVCALILAYTLFGAALFLRVEGGPASDAASAAVRRAARRRRLAADALWSLTAKHNVLEESRWRAGVAQRILSHQEALVAEVRRDAAAEWALLGAVEGPSSGGGRPQWTFAAALMYALTVYTTIGYGHLTPRTFWGKVATMAYALAGIPLMLLYMASVGDILASAFRYAYFNFLCRGAGRKRRPPRRSASRSRRARSHADSVDSDSDFLAGGGGAAYEGEASEAASGRSVARRRGGSGRSSSKGDKQIPVWACLSVIAGFVAGGATLFSAWEGWPLLDAAYFCVVSLVTVGFGDLVPGDAFRGAETTEGATTPMTATKAPESITAGATTEALTTATTTDATTMGPSSAARRLLDTGDYIDMYEEYVDLVSTTAPTTSHPEEDLTPAFGGVFSDYVTTKDMMMVDGKLTFCALYLLTGMALLAMNFHLMQETGLRAARRMLDRLRPSWGQPKGRARERSAPPPAVGAHHVAPHVWGARGEAWRRRTWAGEGRRRGEYCLGRRGSWAESGTDRWESEEDVLEGTGGGASAPGGVVITLQAEDGAVYDWEPGGGGYSSNAVSAEEGIDECGGGRIEEKHGEARHEEDEEEVDFRKSSSIRSSGGRRSRTPRMTEGPEGMIVAASRGQNRLEVPSKANAEDQIAVASRRLQQEDPRRFQRSRSLGPEAPPPQADWRRSPSRRSLTAGADRVEGGGGREGGERGARAVAKSKRGPISAWRKRRKRKKGLRRVGVPARQQSGFRNPFFSTSSLDRIPPDRR
ncbi:uncharacterized protein LOC124156551 [Ischnura elegans]|uniref:uncharacterized protein LOC124156551 n=1 Tax=Ischnura elegans TaxID=197161 RepID=UPI001ED892E6|nr:uncharacterized protein LOC124156551 [Ischnura elegans]